MPRKSEKPRKSITVSVDQESLDLVVEFFTRVGQDLSGMVDAYIQSMARTIRATGLNKKKDLTRADVLRLALAGIKEQP